MSRRNSTRSATSSMDSTSSWVRASGFRPIRTAARCRWWPMSITMASSSNPRGRNCRHGLPRGARPSVESLALLDEPRISRVRPGHQPEWSGIGRGDSFGHACRPEQRGAAPTGLVIGPHARNRGPVLQQGRADARGGPGDRRLESGRALDRADRLRRDGSTPGRQGTAPPGEHHPETRGHEEPDPHREPGRRGLADARPGPEHRPFQGRYPARRRYRYRSSPYRDAGHVEIP